MRIVIAIALAVLLPISPARGQLKNPLDGYDEGFIDFIKEGAKIHNDKRTVEQIFKDNALIRAAAAGDVKAIRKALKAGALVNSYYIDGGLALGSDGSGYTALMDAASRGHVEVVKLLIAEKADVNLKCINFHHDGETALYRAVVRKKDAVVELLVKAGAKEDSKQIRLGLDLRRAACRGFKFKDGQGYPNHPGNAGGKGTLEIGEMLKRGADVNAADPAGYTSLMYAANLGLVENVKTLLDHGADATLKTYSSLSSTGGTTALSLAEAESSYAPAERRQVVELLKSHLATVAGTEKPRGNWRVVEALPSAGMERLIFDRETITIVHYATRKGVYRYQIDAKANPAHIDVLHEDGSECRGIYDVYEHTDSLKICLGPWMGERPVDFTAKGKNVVALTLVREEVADKRHVERWEGINCFVTRDAKQIARDGQAGQPIVALDFIGCDLKDADLKKLAGVKKTLKSLTLRYNTNVTDAGLCELACLENLEVLNLFNTSIGDAGLKELTPLKRLQKLSLAYTRVTDAGVKGLITLQSLEYLDLRETAVTGASVDKLKKALPKCEIVRPEPAPKELDPEACKKALLEMMRSKAGQALGFFEKKLVDEMEKMPVEKKKEEYHWTGAYRFNPPEKKTFVLFVGLLDDLLPLRPHPKGYLIHLRVYQGAFELRDGRWIAAVPKWKYNLLD